MILLGWNESAGTAEEAEAHDLRQPGVWNVCSFPTASGLWLNRLWKNPRVAMAQIFQRYGIDPKAKPDFDKLMEARHELQELEAHQKAAG